MVLKEQHQIWLDLIPYCWAFMSALYRQNISLNLLSMTYRKIVEKLIVFGQKESLPKFAIILNGV